MNFSLRVKLLGIAGLLLALMTITGVIAVRNLSDVGKKVFADGAVSKKHKELTALAVAVSQNCFD